MEIKVEIIQRRNIISNNHVNSNVGDSCKCKTPEIFWNFNILSQIILIHVDENR